MKKLLLIFLPFLMFSCSKESRLEKIISSRLSQECTEYKALQTTIKDTLTAEEAKQWIDGAKSHMDTLNSSKLRIAAIVEEMETDLTNIQKDLGKYKSGYMHEMLESTASDLQISITNSKNTISELDAAIDTMNVTIESMNNHLAMAQGNIIYYLVAHEFECNGQKELSLFKFSEKLDILE